MKAILTIILITILAWILRQFGKAKTKQKRIDRIIKMNYYYPKNK